MAYTTFLATTAEISLFLQSIDPGRDFEMSSANYETFRNKIHALAEVRILQWLNRTDLTPTTLAADEFLEAALNGATIMFVSNFFLYWKQQRMGRVIELNEMLVQILNPKIFTEEIKDLLRPHRYPKVGPVDRADETDEDELWA